MTRFTVTVQPRSKKRGVFAFGEGFKVYTHAPPVDGEANQDIIDVVAEALSIPKSSIVLIAGHISKQKTLGVEGLSLEEIHARLGKLL